MTDYVLNAETGLLGTLLTQPEPKSDPAEPKPEQNTEEKDHRFIQ